MKTYYESEYVTVKYDEENSILYSYWDTPVNLPDKEYRKEIENDINVAVKLKPQFKFVHLKKAKYVVPVETHEWLTSKINKFHETYDIKKVAIIVSVNFLAHLSFELVKEEIETKNSISKFFANEDEAIDWLKTEENVKINAA